VQQLDIIIILGEKIDRYDLAPYSTDAHSMLQVSGDTIASEEQNAATYQPSFKATDDTLIFLAD